MEGIEKMTLKHAELNTPLKVLTIKGKKHIKDICINYGIVPNQIIKVILKTKTIWMLEINTAFIGIDTNILNNIRVTLND